MSNEKEICEVTDRFLKIRTQTAAVTHIRRWTWGDNQCVGSVC